MTVTAWESYEIQQESTSYSQEGAPAPHFDVIEIVTQLLGPEIWNGSSLLAEGYRTLAEESLALAESNVAASAETLPPE